MWPILLSGLVLAGSGPDLSQLSERFTATCPERGLCRLELPPSFVADNPDAWLVLNSAGAPVPWAVLREDASPAMPRATRVGLTSDPNTVSLSVPEDCAVEAVELDFSWGSFQAAARAQVQLRGQEGWTSGPWGLVGAGLIDEERVALRVPEGPVSALRLSFDRPWTTLPADMDTRLLCRDAAWVAPAVVELSPGPTGPAESGASRYTFTLPERARIVGVELHPEGDVFRRPVSVATWQPSDGDLRPVAQSSGTIQRIKVGDLAVDHTRLEGIYLSADRLAIDVEDGDDAPLVIPRAEAVLARRVLLLRDAGAVTVYGGDPGLALSYDLQLAASELARAPSQTATRSDISPNPAFVEELSGDALSPGAVVDRERFLYSREVQGEGVTRIPLPLDVLAHARPDLGDLRLLDGEGRQIPFVVDWGGVDQLIEGVTFEPEQEGQTSRLRLRLPLDTTPISTLHLHSPDQDFSRAVSVYTGMDGGRALLAHAFWSAAPQAEAALVIRLDSRVDRGLLVEIEHGDNRVITVDRVELRRPTAALVARLPPGVTLLYGDRAELRSGVEGPLKRVRDNDWAKPLTRPSYDAARLSATLMRAPAREATLGPEVSLASASPSPWDHNVASIGIGVLVVGLLGLVGWLLKGVPGADDERPAGGGPTG